MNRKNFLQKLGLTAAVAIVPNISNSTDFIIQNNSVEYHLNKRLKDDKFLLKKVKSVLNTEILNFTIHPNTISLSAHLSEIIFINKGIDYCKFCNYLSIYLCYYEIEYRKNLLKEIDNLNNNK
jgi:hypothetical protein